MHVCLLLILQLIRNTLFHGPGYTEDAALCMKCLQVIWDTLGKIFKNLFPIIQGLVCAFSLLVLPVLTNFFIQVQEDESLVKMMLEYPRNQSWKKVKGLHNT